MGKHSKRNEKTGSYTPDGKPMGIKKGPDPERSELQKKADDFDALWKLNGGKA